MLGTLEQELSHREPLVTGAGTQTQVLTGAACTLDCRITSPALICQCYSTINVCDKSVYKEKKPNMVSIFRGVNHGWLALFTSVVVSEDAVYSGGKKRAKQMSANLPGTDREVYIGVPQSLQGHTPSGLRTLTRPQFLKILPLPHD